ncbi:MAG: hypothetical protein E4H36_09445 [Spirochaetales bacterium]|nr:MAG: hypothetical protein E4H36_09445 [Spirochaetales bacterium]
MREFLIFSLLIYGSLFTGYGIQRLFSRSSSRAPLLNRILILLSDSPTMLLIYWSISWTNFVAGLRIGLIPLFLGVLLGAAAFGAARLKKFERQRTGVYIVAAMVSNNGMTLGGFLCLLLLGTEGLKYSQMYVLYMVPFIYIVVFSIGRIFSVPSGERFTQVLKAIAANSFTLIPLACVATGIILSNREIAFPAFLDVPKTILVYVSAGGYSFSFGLTLDFKDLVKNIRASLPLLLLKYFLGPAAGALFAVVLGFSLRANPTAFKVIVIQAVMPVALLSVVIARLNNLGDRFAVSLWLINTLSTALIFPLLWVFVRYV